MVTGMPENRQYFCQHINSWRAHVQYYWKSNEYWQYNWTCAACLWWNNHRIIIIITEMIETQNKYIYTMLKKWKIRIKTLTFKYFLYLCCSSVIIFDLITLIIIALEFLDLVQSACDKLLKLCSQHSVTVLYRLNKLLLWRFVHGASKLWRTYWGPTQKNEGTFLI